MGEPFFPFSLGQAVLALCALASVRRDGLGVRPGQPMRGGQLMREGQRHPAARRGSPTIRPAPPGEASTG